MGGVAFVGGPLNGATWQRGDGCDFISAPPDDSCPECVYVRTPRHVDRGALSFTLFIWVHLDAAERAWSRLAHSEPARD